VRKHLVEADGSLPRPSVSISFPRSICVTDDASNNKQGSSNIQHPNYNGLRSLLTALLEEQSSDPMAI
jgi:hypothetical protein